MKRPDLEERAARAVRALPLSQVRRLAMLDPEDIALAISGDEVVDDETVHALRVAVHRLCCARLAG